MKWYFFEKNDPTKLTASQFSDSKFSIDKWTSFTREIIQNSLDAVDDLNKPVIVEFNYDFLSKDEVPELGELKNVIQKCFEYTESPYTKEKYEIGLKYLKNSSLMFLKVSDYNTKGVCQSIKGKDAWEALVINEGESIKESRNSGGSHGVGKKAPFIMSPIHTVFYSTYNKEGNQLFQGKTILTDWVDANGVRRSGKGWLGMVDESNNRFLPLPLRNNFDDINSFFIREKHQGKGTDIIIALLESTDEDIINIKKLIINSALENFFVAILESKLELKIFGEILSITTYDTIMEKYYDDRIKNRDTGYDNVKFGNLNNYTKAFLSPQKKEIIKIPNMGNVVLYFMAENSKNRKNYSIVRSQGMKIRDVRVGADKPFSAVALIEGDELNAYLLSLENAAHDDFVAPDNLSREEEKARLKTLNLIYNKIESFIRKETKIEANDIQDLEGLNEMIEFAGNMVDAKQRKPRVKEFNNTLDYINSVGSPNGKGDSKAGRIGGSKSIAKPGSDGRRNPYGEGEQRIGFKTDSFITPPYFVYQAKTNTYILTMEPRYNFTNVSINIFAVNSDENKNSIYELIDDVSDKNGKRYLINENGVITGLNLLSGERKSIHIRLKDNFKYQLKIEMEGKLNEQKF